MCRCACIPMSLGMQCGRSSLRCPMYQPIGHSCYIIHLTHHYPVPKWNVVQKEWTANGLLQAVKDGFSSHFLMVAISIRQMCRSVASPHPYNKIDGCPIFGQWLTVFDFDNPFSCPAISRGCHACISWHRIDIGQRAPNLLYYIPSRHLLLGLIHYYLLNRNKYLHAPLASQPNIFGYFIRHSIRTYKTYSFSRMSVRERVLWSFVQNVQKTLQFRSLHVRLTFYCGRCCSVCICSKVDASRYTAPTCSSLQSAIALCIKYLSIDPFDSIRWY